jgi:hypothetical protein
MRNPVKSNHRGRRRRERANAEKWNSSTSAVGGLMAAIYARRGWRVILRRDVLKYRAGPTLSTGRLPRLAAAERSQSRAERFVAVYLRDAQAYMLISMPTDTSTIFGVFQVIRGPPN